MRDEVCGTCKYYDELQNGYCEELNCNVEPEELGCSRWILYKEGLEHEADAPDTNVREMEVQE